MKTRAQIHPEITAIRSVEGLAASDDVTEKVMACCGAVNSTTVEACVNLASSANVGATPFGLVFQLAMQLIPIIYETVGFTTEKLIEAFCLIQSIFS